jgi:hypothetical protein
MKFIFPYIGNDKPTWLIFFRGVGIPPTRGSLTLVGKPLVLWWGEITRFFYLVSYFARRIIVRLLSWVVSTLQCVPLAIFHDHVYFETSVNEMGKTLATGLLMFFLITGRYTSRIFVDHNNGNPLLMTQPVYYNFEIFDYTNPSRLTIRSPFSLSKSVSWAGFCGWRLRAEAVLCLVEETWGGDIRWTIATSKDLAICEHG